MTRKYLCDCCQGAISGRRISGEMAPFYDLCKDCYNGFLSIKKIMDLTKDKSILDQLNVIKDALNGNR